MTYTKTDWVQNVTPVDEARMDNIESGIFTADANATLALINYGASPPGSPVDGTLWCLPADATNGVMWLFRYRAASASAYKWEFVGGPPVNQEGSGGTANGTSAWTAFGGWTDFTCARAGEYFTDGGFSGTNTGAAKGTFQMSLSIAGAAPVANLGGQTVNATDPFSAAMIRRLVTMTAGQTLAPRYWSNQTASWNVYQFGITPRRVS